MAVAADLNTDIAKCSTNRPVTFGSLQAACRWVSRWCISYSFDRRRHGRSTSIPS